MSRVVCLRLSVDGKMGVAELPGRVPQPPGPQPPGPQPLSLGDLSSCLKAVTDGNGGEPDQLITDGTLTILAETQGPRFDSSLGHFLHVYPPLPLSCFCHSVK